MLPAATAQRGSTAFRSAAQNLLRDLLAEGRRRGARPRGRSKRRRGVWLQEFLEMLGSVAGQRSQARAREERHGTRELLRERLAQDRVRKVAPILVRLLRLFTPGGQSFTGNTAFAEERIPLTAKQAASAVSYQAGEV